MPLTLVLGPANSAKAGEVLGAFSAAAPGGAVLVVPTAEDARHYTRELAAEGTVLGSILTFSGLAAEIARRVELPWRPLSPLQREAVLERALKRADLGALGEPARTPGFLSAAGRLVAELAQALITPERFAAALAQWAQEDHRRHGYARALASVYSSYARELERCGRLDGELSAWRALDALRREPGRWGADRVFFYGFDELTALERDAVETLARIVGVPVTVSLTFEAGRAALEARAGAVQELVPLAERVVELPPLEDHYAPASRAALHHLERRLFEPAGERLDPGGAVVLLEAGGELAEAELIAAEVLGLLRAGVPGEEIAVVRRGLARGGSALERVLAQYGVPVAGARELPLTHVPLGRALRGAAACAFAGGDGRGGASVGDLLDYLRAPGVLDPVEADRVEARIAIEGMRDAAAARARLGLALPELDRLAAAARPLEELCELGRRLLAAPFQGQAPALAGPEQLDARALAALVRAREELDELGLTPPGRGLVALLDRLRVPAGSPHRPGEVLLSEPLQVRARRFRAVLVAGLQEGEFPAAGRPEPFLGDEQRRELAACAGLRLRAHEDALARERHLFYMVLSRATERVALSYRSSDEEGNLALPSPFVADVAQLWRPGWRERRRRRLLADVIWPEELAPTENERARARAAAAAPVAGEPPVAERRLGAAALAELRHGRILSAGALESYADCPMRWLIERELQPRELEPEPEPRARGSVMHDLLERLLRRLAAPVTPASLERARELLDELLGEDGPVIAGQLAAGGSDVVRAGALRSVEADLRRYLEHEAGAGRDWRPLELELRFGFDAEEEPAGGGPSLPPLQLGDPAAPVLVRGLIDRVDVDPSGRRALVLDYKSSARAEHRGARWTLDRQLQVALYMLVVRELLQLEPVAGLYQPLRGESLRPRGAYLAGEPLGSSVVANDARAPEELAAMLEDASERAVALAEALRSGTVTPCPQTCSRDGCAHPGICRSR